MATLFRNLDSEEVYLVFWTRKHRKKKTGTGAYDMDLVLFCLHISRKTIVQTCLTNEQKGVSPEEEGDVSHVMLESSIYFGVS